MNGNVAFSYEIIRDYLISQGGRVEYHKLIKHFKDALANPENKETRVLFKDLVNQVAVVTTEGNQKYLSLRANVAAEEPPRLPPRSTSEQASSGYHDSRSNLNFQATANQYYDAQSRLPNQTAQFAQINPPMPKPIGQPPLQMPKQQAPFNPHQQPNYPPRLYPSNLDPSLSNQINSQLSNQLNNQLGGQLNQQAKLPPNPYQILDTQPRQPFSYNLNQPVPAFLNQRVHPAELNSLESVQLIQPKPVPTIPSLPNMMNPNLINLTRYPQSRNVTELPPVQPQNPPLPAKNQWSNSNSDCPPKAPPRRKSFASGSNTYLNKKGATNHVKDNENFLQTGPKQFTDKIKEINELKFNSPGRVKEHAKKLNKMVSESELKPPMPLGSNNASNANIQNNLRDESDLNDQVKRRWMVKSSACDYNELQQMLKDYPKLAEFKDITSGYNALHWAAKFNKPDIIKLIAGTHNVSPNIKTSGYTPLHLAAMFDHKEVMELLIKGYGADNTIRDYSGRTADDLLRINKKKSRILFNSENGSRKNGQESEASSRGSGLLARTASLRQTRQLFDKLPTMKYRTMK